MKCTKKQLRSLIRETLDEMSTAQAQADGPIRDFVASMQQAKKSLGKDGAKKALGVIYQQVKDQKAGQNAEKLLNAVNQIETSIETVVKWLDKMPELTKDSWSHVGKRD
jgi:membrane-associated HD superfamily phosphohydrolase